MPQVNQELNGTYLIIEKIGSGGGGTVYKAYHKNLKKEVVLKKIHTGLLKGNTRAEVDILKNLKSQYLPQVYDFLKTDSEVYTVMDYIPGQALKDVLQDKPSFTQKRVIKWMDQLCQAVEQLHSQTPPIIHGDIKPANIMLTPKDDICLIDFNISGDFQASDIMGFTPGYAAPEQMESVALLKANLKAANAQNVSKNVRDEKEAMNAPAYPLAAGEQDTTEQLEQGEDATELLEQGAAVTEYLEQKADATEYLEQLINGALTATVKNEDATQTAIQAEGAVKLSAGGHSSDTDARVKDSAGKSSPMLKIRVDQRSDIYSIGATIYHLLTGQRPDPDHLQPLWELNSSVEDSLAYLIMKCLEKDPSKRYQSIQVLHNAVLNVHKSSTTYKGLLFRQFCIRLVLAAGVIGFAALAGLGRVQMQQEKQDSYDEYVSLIGDSRRQQNYEEADGYYQQAVALYPDGAAAALEMVETLYQQKRYQDTIEFVRYSVIDIVTEEQALGDIYFIYGNSYFELGQFEAAEAALRQAISYNGSNSQFYRDHAIVLARLDRAEEAGAQLDLAIQCQLEDDSIYYVQGEIYVAQENWEEAFSSFLSCIENTSDDYMKMRAYMMCNNALEQEEDNLEEQRTILEEARKNLPVEYQNAILEELAQVYIDLANASGDSYYDMEAVDVFQTIINYGWGVYATYNNIAVLYQKNRMYSQEEEVLNTMLNQYGEDYNTYKRLAFMEAGVQMLLENEDRDFQVFSDYYAKAAALYEEQLNNNQTDLEMTALKDLYQQAVDGGWIED